MNDRFKILKGTPQDVEEVLNELVTKGQFVKVISSCAMGTKDIAVTCFVRPDKLTAGKGTK
jgi:hypothetical protein